jgi:hypothetical protein
MTEDMIELGRRAVACKGWTWMPGMLRHDGYRYVGSGVWVRWSETSDLLTALHMPGQFPDLSDSATLGCLLDLCPAVIVYAWAGCMGEEDGLERLVIALEAA